MTTEELLMDVLPVKDLAAIVVADKKNLDRYNGIINFIDRHDLNTTTDLENSKALIKMIQDIADRNFLNQFTRSYAVEAIEPGSPYQCEVQTFTYRTEISSAIPYQTFVDMEYKIGKLVRNFGRFSNNRQFKITQNLRKSTTRFNIYHEMERNSVSYYLDYQFKYYDLTTKTEIDTTEEERSWEEMKDEIYQLYQKYDTIHGFPQDGAGEPEEIHDIIDGDGGFY